MTNITVLALIDRAENALADAMLADEPLELAMNQAARKLQAAVRFDPSASLIAIRTLLDLADRAGHEIERDICTQSAEILQRARNACDGLH